MGLTKAQKVVLVPVIIFILLIVWGLFPLFFKWVMIGIGAEKTKIEDFGTLGDIYGSLNTLFTSATLIIVIYSAYLQREANKDARQSMEEQLSQAKLLSEEAINKQTLHHEEQLLKAEKALAAQEKEAKDNIFSNNFFNLLNYKEERLKSLYILQDDKKLDADIIFYNIQKEFQRIIQEVFTLNQNPKNEDIINPLFAYMRTISEECHDKILSYLSLYISLINTIKYSHHDAATKWHFIQLLSDSMNVNEQLVLFAISPEVPRFQLALEESYLFGVFNGEYIRLYARKFHKKTHFWSMHLIEEFPDE